MEAFDSIADVQRQMVGGYRSRRWRHHTFSYYWDAELAKATTAINPDRAEKRVASYVIPEELIRAKRRLKQKPNFSMRFGVRKEGQGNFGARGDFCLLGADWEKKKLTLHYRSLELFGGLVYDQAIILELQRVLKIDIRFIICMCSSTHSFALKRNSNEMLWKKLQPIYEEYGV